MPSGPTRTEIAALLAVAQDHAFGQSAGSQLRATVLGQHLALAAGLADDERAATWWTSSLRFLGCTGHSFEMAPVFGDEIEMRSASLRIDASSPADIVRLTLQHAGPGRSPIGRIKPGLVALATGRQFASLNFRAACEVADAFATRLGLDQGVRAALGANFERWNGRGLPNGVTGDAIPLPMRVAQLTHELEVLARVEGLRRAIDTIKSRRGKAYDPDLTDLLTDQAPTWWADLDASDVWDQALQLAPHSIPLDGVDLAEALLVVADFADLKSPWRGGHSRAVAALARTASGPDAEAAALLHDVGVVAVPNTIWDKPTPLTHDEHDRMETHTLVTDQLLRRIPWTARLAPIAAAAHERLDGSGYHRRVTAAHLDLAQRVVAAADCYQALTSARPHRPAHSPTQAAAELRSMTTTGRLEGEAVERVLAAAGLRREARPPLPSGLTARETEVLRELTFGATIRQIAHKLVISPKTAEHHVQHIYTKIGVSTRGAAALFAIRHGLVPSDPTSPP